MCHWCLKTGHVMKDCRAKQQGKPKAVKGANSLELGPHAPAAADWYEDRRQDRDAGSLLRDRGTLMHEDDYDLNGEEFTGQDWIEESETEEYDESFVPPGGFPARSVAQTVAPANGFVPSGPRSFPAEFADESPAVINVSRTTDSQDPWAIDGDPWSASPAGSSSSASVAPSSSLH